jgi:hypothetical protein
VEGRGNGRRWGSDGHAFRSVSTRLDSTRVDWSALTHSAWCWRRATTSGRRTERRAAADGSRPDLSSRLQRVAE